MNPLYFPDVPQKMGLYPVVDSIDWLSRLLNAGVRTLQLRLKTPSFEKHNPTVTQSVAPGRCFHARVFINDDWQQAIQHRAYGVHLGQTDLDGADLNAISEAGLRPGISTHDDHEIDPALAIHSSYIALGHVFATQTKIMATSPQGLPLLAGYVARLAEYPNVAIGGISLAHAPEVLATGVGNIAVISAITQAPDWRQATGKLLALTGSGGNETS